MHLPRPAAILLGLSLGLLGADVRASEAPKRAMPDANEVQRWLLGGNAWFVRGGTPVSDVDPERRETVAPAQFPWVTVLTCADSRVPPEHIFNAGLGQMFTVRVAGNVADPVTVGSIEYAAEHLGTPLVIVMGHERCGAVKAAMGSDSLGPNLDSLLGLIRPAIQGQTDLDAAVRLNTHAQVAALRRSAILSHLEHEKKLTFLAAYYDLDTGAASFQEPVAVAATTPVVVKKSSTAAAPAAPSHASHPH